MAEFAAFLSYAHLDDEYQDGKVTEFRIRLENTVRMWTGERGFQVFQDTKDICWGQQWADKVSDALADVLVLIPIMTPLYFNSSACRDEYDLFLKREERLARNDLILPVYWLDCDVLDDQQRRDADEWAKGLAAHQRVNWRELRTLPSDAPAIIQAMDGFALQMKQVLAATATISEDTTLHPEAARPARVRRPKISNTETEQIETPEAPVETVAEEATKTGSLEAEPPTRTVDAMGRRDYISLVDAINDSNPGDRLLVRPGFYPGRLALDKPLEIIGDGDSGDIVVQASGSNVIISTANMVIVRNLTIRQVGGGDWYAIDISQGRLVLEQCDISSQSLACVAVHNAADPVVRRNRIHDGKQGGIYVYENGRGTFEDNDVFGNTYSGVSVTRGADPIVRRNRIHDGKSAGIYVYDNGRGTFEDNDVFGNSLAGVFVREGADPVVRRNRIHDGKQPGIHVHDNGRGTFEDNDVFGNGLAGVSVREGADPVVRRNRIHDGKASGIHVYENGRGTFEDNDVFGNSLAGVTVREGAEPVVRRNRIHDGKSVGIHVHDNGRGTFEDNDLRGNQGGSWNIADGCTVRRARNQEDPVS